MSLSIYPFMSSGDAPMEEATRGKVSEIPQVQIPLEDASRTEVSTMPSGDAPMEEATQGKVSEIPQVQIPLEEASQAEVSTMPSGDAPMEEATQGKVFEIPPGDVPLKESIEKTLPTQCLANITVQDMPVDFMHGFLSVELTPEEMNELVASSVVVLAELVQETEPSQEA
uniref:fibrous sheath CABYR-binding protein-like n=1 Tax=Scatophagus argus TaxID=75038 RepID=UPI001ED848CC|nr:fibrous sheath CABYR-binding protein-like [Scatophagus argus]